MFNLSLNNLTAILSKNWRLPYTYIQAEVMNIIFDLIM